MQKLIALPLMLIITTMLSGCNWVQLTNEGSGVRVASLSEVANCTRVGTTSSATTSRVIVQRGGERVQNELITLARNEAGLMGGNAIVASSTIQDGRQSFVVYRCP